VYFNERGEPYAGNALLKEKDGSTGDNDNKNKPLMMQLPSDYYKQWASVDRKKRVAVRKKTESDLGNAVSGLIHELSRVHRTLRGHRDPAGLVLPDTYDLSVMQDGLYRSAQRLEQIRESLGTSSSGIGNPPAATEKSNQRNSVHTGAGSGSGRDRTVATDSSLNPTTDELLDAPQRSVDYFRRLQEKLDETAVLIPFLGSKGMGNSETEFRGRYLKLTIRSLKPFFKHIYGTIESASRSASISTPYCIFNLWPL
jgi:hypothetical protein